MYNNDIVSCNQQQWKKMLIMSFIVMKILTKEVNGFYNSDFSSLKNLDTIMTKKSYQIIQVKEENLNSKEVPSRLFLNSNESNEFSDDIGTPLELESLQQQEQPTLFGLERRQDIDDDDSTIGTGIPLFTGVIILFCSTYFIISGFLGFDDTITVVPLDANPIIESFLM